MGEKLEIISKAYLSLLGIKEREAIYLGNLKTGAALCHKEGMNLPVFVFVDDVIDVTVVDETLLSKREGKMFDEINYSLIKENTKNIIQNISLQLLNDVMASGLDTVIKSIDSCKDVLDKELIKKDVVLVFCRNKNRVFGKVLAENIIQYLVNGVYSFKALLSDDLYQAIAGLLEKEKIEDVEKVRSLMKKGYMQEPKNRCTIIVSELIKRSYNKGTNVRKSIEQYFYNGEERLFEEIEEMVRRGGT